MFDLSNLFLQLSLKMVNEDGTAVADGKKTGPINNVKLFNSECLMDHYFINMYFRCFTL